MRGRHRALIVEDDKAGAEDLELIIKALGCDSVVVDNKSDALAALKKRAFCFVLLDLEIKEGSDSIKGHVENGRSLLREMRRLCPDHTGVIHWMPIVVVSGFANEVDAAVEVMKDGAADVVRKPFSSSDVSAKIRSVLERSGRSAHDDCRVFQARPSAAAHDQLVLSIPGDRLRRRTLVTVNARPVYLTDSSLTLLLQLLVAHARGSGVHKRDLGATDEQGFKGISVLRAALEPAAGVGDTIPNDHHGGYRLAAHVTIGACDINKLIAIDHLEITPLAAELGRLLKRRRKSDGNSG